VRLGGVALSLSLALLCAAPLHAQDKGRHKRAAAAHAKPKKAEAKSAAPVAPKPKSEAAAPAHPPPSAAPHAAADDEDVRKEGGTEVKTVEFTGLDIEGQLKTPQMLYFLNRLRAEFDRPRLPHRSFMPELSRSTREKDF
jgi:hypothetical protein